MWNQQLFLYFSFIQVLGSGHSSKLKKGTVLLVWVLQL